MLSSRERENNNCECQECIQNENASKPTTHHERCGCHSCFLENCSENRSLNKDKLRNIIRNFLLRKDNIASDLKSHHEECMCVSHLLYYRENKISVLDNFLDKQKSGSENNTNIPSNLNQEKPNSNIEKPVKSKSISPIE